MNNGPPAQSPSILARAALVLISVTFSAVAYYPIIGNYFYLDDFLNLYRIQNLNPLEYLFIPHGGHLLLARNGLFFLFAEVFGPEPSRFFWAVLLTHLLNVALLFAAIRAWTGSALLACIGATLFGTSPVNEGALGWYSVYGQVVVATLFLPILISAARLGSTGRQPSRGQRWVWYGLTLVACTCFGVGIGLALSLPFVLLAVLPRRERRPWLPPLASLFVVVPTLYVVSHWTYSILSGEEIPAGFLATLYFGDLPNVASTLFHLIGYGGTQLVMGFYLLRPSQYDLSMAYAWAVVLADATVLAWVRGSAMGRRRMIAGGLIVVGCYAMIALGRTTFLSYFDPSVVKIVSEPRYHYVGFVTLTLLMCVIVDNVLAGASHRRVIEFVLLGLSLVVIGSGYAWRRPAIDHHVESRRATQFALNWIRASIAKTPPGKVTYLFNRPFTGVPPAVLPQAVLPGWAALYVIFHPDDSGDEKPVRFVEYGNHVLEAARQGRRSASLLIGPAEWQREKMLPPEAKATPDP